MFNRGGSKIHAIGELATPRKRRYLLIVCITLLSITVLIVFKAKSDEFECPMGMWCFRDIFQYECPAGRFGNKTGLTNSNCSGVCESGFYCPSGSTSSQQVACPAGHYCKRESEFPVPCPPGTFQSDTHATSCDGICDQGFFCLLGSTSPVEYICPIGHYCPLGTTRGDEFKCSQGYYGSSVGQTTDTCTGVCTGKLGHYCPAGTSYDGSISSNLDICPIGSFCDGSIGDTSRQLCSGGRFSNTTGSSNSTCNGLCQEGYYCPAGSDIQVPCPPGSICAAGVEAPDACPPGTFNQGTHNTECNGICSGGSWCGSGSASSTAAPCPPGYYCPAGISDYTVYPCWEGYACPNGTARPMLECDLGHYCPSGTPATDSFPCPEGTFGSFSKLTTSDCSGVCPAGAWCGVGTIRPIECQMGYFCPANSTNTLQHPCAGGKFSKTTGLVDELECECDRFSDPTCEFNNGCPAGYYCPPGSTDPRANPCPENYYCFENSTYPSLCRETGFYCSKRETSPFALVNYARVILLNNLPQKSAQWAQDNPKSWERLKFKGKSLEDAFVEDSESSYYTGSMYENDFFSSLQRGLNTVSVNVTTRGFFNATISLCMNGAIQIEIGGFSKRIPNSDQDTPASTFTFTWDIPRDYIDHNFTVCTTFPHGGSSLTVFSDVFEITGPGQVEAMKRYAILSLAIPLLASIGVISPFFLLRAERSRLGEVQQVVSPPPHPIFTLGYFFNTLLEAPQLLTLTMYQPVIQNSSLAPFFRGIHIVSLNFTPLIGAEISIVIYLVVFLLGQILKKYLRYKRRQVSVGTLAVFWDVLYNTLYIPIQITLLSVLDCAYSNSEENFEFYDQVYIRNFMHVKVQCWRSMGHIVLAVIGFIISLIYQGKAMKYAFEESTHRSIRFISFFKLMLLTVKTLLCYGTVILTASSIPALYFVFTFTCTMFLMVTQFKFNPGLGRNWKINDRKFAIYVVSVLSCVVVFASTLIGDYNTTCTLFRVFLGSSCIIAYLATLISRQRSKNFVRLNSFKNLTDCQDTRIRDASLDSALDFMVNIHRVEKSSKKRMQVLVLEFLEHLGTLSQSENSKIKDPTVHAISNILKSNCNGEEIFSVRYQYLIHNNKTKRLTRRLQRRNTKLRLVGTTKTDLKSVAHESKSICGIPSSMMIHCLTPIMILNLSGQGLGANEILFLGSLLGDLPQLRLLDLSNNHKVHSAALLAFLTGMSDNQSIMHFKFIQGAFGIPHAELLSNSKALSKMMVKRAIQWKDDPSIMPLTRIDLGDMFRLYMTLKPTRGRGIGSSGDNVLHHELKLLSSDAVIQALDLKMHGSSTIDFTPGSVSSAISELSGMCSIAANGFVLNVDSNLCKMKNEVGTALLMIGKNVPMGSLILAPFAVEPSTTSMNLKGALTMAEDRVLLLGLLTTQPNLRVVDLRLNNIEVSDAMEIARIVQNNQILETITMNHVELPISKLRDSVALEFSGACALTDTDAVVAARLLRQNKSLKKLVLHGGSDCLSDIGAHAILDALQEGSIEKLSFGNWHDGNTLGAVSMMDLSLLIGSSCLVSLDLQNNCITSSGCRCIAKALHSNKTITSLKLSNNNVRDEGAASLGEMLVHNKSISKLFLGNNSIGDQGFQFFFQGLFFNSCLKSLVLDNNPISDLPALIRSSSNLESLSMVCCDLENIEPLNEFLKTGCNLTSLNLACNPRMIESCLLVNTSLLQLNLQGCNIEDSFVLGLVDAPFKIQVLDLSQNLITDGACDVLSMLLCTSSLKCISLKLNLGITADGKHQIQASQPSSIIVEL